MSKWDLSPEEAYISLCELIAVIHRDGGHYTDENGLEKSCQDAIKFVHGLHEYRDSN